MHKNLKFLIIYKLIQTLSISMKKLKYKVWKMDIKKPTHGDLRQKATIKMCYVGPVCFTESGFLDTTFQTFMRLFVIRKVGQ